MLMTHLSEARGLRHSSEAKCRGGRGSMKHQPGEGDAGCSTTEKQLVPGEKRMLGGKEF